MRLRYAPLLLALAVPLAAQAQQYPDAALHSSNAVNQDVVCEQERSTVTGGVVTPGQCDPIAMVDRGQHKAWVLPGAIPGPTTSTLGGVKSATPPAHQFLTGVDTSGNPTYAQPGAGDIAGLASSATTDATNAANITTGTLAQARLPAVLLKPYTVAGLPSCGAGLAGALAYVTDAASPAYNGALTGGGTGTAAVTLALCNGSGWTAH